MKYFATSTQPKMVARIENMAVKSRSFCVRRSYMCALVTLACTLVDISTGTLLPETEEEFCNRDTFIARCPAGHVIEVTRAVFGRMRLSRCVTNDVIRSCDVDALPLLHRECSGLRACSMDVSEIDKLLVNFTQPVCTNDYRLHLYSSYRCIPVETEPDQTCMTSDGPLPVEVHSPEGYLASLTTRETSKGSERCPWHIRAQPGQRIQVSLHNYNSQIKQSDSMCHIYAYIRERALPNSESKLMDCGYGSLQGRVFTSLSESLDVVIIDPDGNRNFVLHYKAVGCPDVKAGEGAIIVRKGNKTTITCDQQAWTLTCQHGEWLGDQGDCIESVRTQAANFPWPNSWTQEFTIVLIITVAVLIAVVIVVVGVCMVRRSTANDFQPIPHRTGEYGVYGLRGPVVPSKCYYPTLSLPTGSVCHGSGSESSHYTTTMQRRQAVPPGSVPPSVEGFAPHFLQQSDLTSCASCPVHSCASRSGTYHDRVGASGWQTFPVRRPDHIYASPKFARKQTHDPPYYHELDRDEVERQLRQQTAHQREQQETRDVPRIPTEDELVSDGDDDPLPPSPPPLPPDNER